MRQRRPCPKSDVERAGATGLEPATSGRPAGARTVDEVEREFGPHGWIGNVME